MTVRSSFLRDPVAPKLAQQGFTLVELAVALFVIGLLLAGALIPLSTQMEVRSIADTRRIMDQINEALIGFAQANGRLPCPADPTLQSGVGTAGLAQYDPITKKCNLVGGVPVTLGVIPWSTLGVPETDAWGRRFRYRVALAFSDDYTTNSTWVTITTLPIVAQSEPCPVTPIPTLASFALCALGEIAVLNRTTDAALSKPAPGVQGSGLATVFLSHGRNGYGGYQTSGVQVSGLSANTDEATNLAGTTTGNPGGGPNTSVSYLFYSRTPTPYSADCSETIAGKVFCEYDDIVYMISASTLVSRLISAGRLP